MQSEFISNDSPTPCRLAIFETSEAQTCRPETGLSLAVFPAKIFPSLVKELGWKVNDLDYGLSTPVSLASYDRDMQSWKTSERSLFEDSIEYSGALPRSGTMRNGKIYAPPMSERPTEGNESGLWATPAAADAVGSHGGGQGRSLRTDISNWKRGMFPTPRSSDADRGGRGDLIQAVRGNPNSHYKTWPTPAARDWKSGNASEETLVRNSRPLNEIVKIFPTPTANRWDGLQSHGVNVVSGQLNPTWVEWLMGYPLGWTDLNVSGIVLSLKSRS